MKQLLIIFMTLLGLQTTFGQDSDIVLPKITKGTLERIENFPSKFVQPRNIDIWLPEKYSPDKKYAVLYMHDGQMLFDANTTWNKQDWGVDEVVGTLLEEQKIQPCIVVGIWNSGSGRHTDYFPQKPFETIPKDTRDSIVNQAKRNANVALFTHEIQSDNYLKFLTTEVKPYIDSHFATSTDRDHTFVAGSSMGGLISWYALCEYPDIFGGAACMSTHWMGIFETENNPVPEAFFQYLSAHLPDPSTHKIYFDYGTETLDAFYEPFQIKADSVMRLRGYESSNWETIKFEGASHDETSWQERLNIPLEFLLGTQRP